MAMADNTVTFKKGEVLFLQGQPVKTLFCLQSGAVEIMAAPEEYTGLDPAIILDHSIRVGIINEKTFIAGISGKTIRAIEDVTAQTISLEPGFAKFAQDDPGRCVTVLAHLFRRLELSFADISKVLKIYQNLCVVGDNLSLMSGVLSAGDPPERIEQRVEALTEVYKKSGGVFPPIFDGNFLITDRSANLKKKYTAPGEPVETLFDRELYTFFKRFLKLDRNIFAHVVKGDPEIAIYIFEKVSSNLVKVIDKIAMIHESVAEEMELLYGKEESWSTFLAEYGALNDWERSARISPEFVRNVVALSGKICASYGELTGKDPLAQYPGVTRIREYLTKAQAPKPAASASTAASASRAATGGGAGKLYANSIQQILEFGVVPNETASQMLRFLNDFRNLSNPFSPDDEARKIRRQATKLYWQIYTMAYQRSLAEQHVPAPVQLMIKYGFFDEKLLEPEQIDSLHSLCRADEKCDFPVLYHHEFLQKIRSGEEPPSLNEVGLTYEKQLREEQEKNGRRGVESEADDPLRKLDYEINNMLQSTVGVCSGSRSTAFPILNSCLLRGNPEQFLVSKQKICAVLSDLLKLDYSAFYRETVTKMNEPILIEEEVLPYIVLLPSFGTKSMMWQELVGTNKRSRARIVFPSFFMGDLKRSMAHSVASFRWEVNRSLQGAMWADPVEGGLTGAYYDYVQFFRKNSKLSTEAKDKLHERIRGVRNNMKELFCEDYITWVTYECEGTMKLNNVVRDIFYRNIPFKREIRERLETMPAFVELANKFKNVRTRKYNEFTRKFKKYEDASGNLPPAFAQYMNFLKM
jgi:hypothetical protein